MRMSVQIHQGVYWYCAMLHSLTVIMAMMTTSYFVCLTNWCVKDGHQPSYDILRLVAWITAYPISFSPVLCFFSLPPSFSPSSVSSSLIYQIVAARSQLSPVWGSFLGWISVKWTHGIGRQSMTLSRDESEWEWWAPRRRCRVEGQKFMLQMHLRSMII